MKNLNKNIVKLYTTAAKNACVTVAYFCTTKRRKMTKFRHETRRLGTEFGTQQEVIDVENFFSKLKKDRSNVSFSIRLLETKSYRKEGYNEV